MQHRYILLYAMILYGAISSASIVRAGKEDFFCYQQGLNQHQCALHGKHALYCERCHIGFVTLKTWKMHQKMCVILIDTTRRITITPYPIGKAGRHSSSDMH